MAPESPRWVRLIAAVYVCLQAWSFWGIAGHGSSFPDTASYESVSKLPLFSLDFWTWYRPWGTPLLWKLLPGPTSFSAPFAQWLLSVGSWLVLALVVYRVLVHPVTKLAGFILVLGFSLVPAVSVWNGALLSESLALSLCALLLAALLLLLNAPSWKPAAAVLVLALLLSGARAPNGFLVPFLLVPVAALLARRARPIAVALVAGSLAVALLTYSTGNVRQWEFALAEIIGARVLHEPAEEAYFVAHGMPVRPTLEADIWGNRVPPEKLPEQVPELAWFVPWFNTEGRTTYRNYLLSHPGDSIVDPIRDLPSMIAPSPSTTDLQGLPLSIYRARGYRAPLPAAVSRILYPSNATLLLALAGVSVVLIAGLGAMRLGRAIWTIPLLGLLSSVPHAIILWNGDDTSIGRHALLLAAVFRLSLFMTPLFVADALAARRRGAGASTSSGSSPS